MASRRRIPLRAALRAGWQSGLVSVDRAVLFRMATSEPLERVVKAAPGGEAAAWRAASRYVAGRSRAEALSMAASLLDRGHGVSLDLFGELVLDLRPPSGWSRTTERWRPRCRRSRRMRGCRWT